MKHAESIPIVMGCVACVCTLSPLAVAGPESRGSSKDVPHERGPCLEWSGYGADDGLPAQKVLAVCVAGDAVWIGTEQGAAVFEEGRWRRKGTRQGLGHPVVFSIAADTETGDVWLGTAGGLTRYSRSRVDVFNQLNSGLANDVVYGVAVHADEVWAATAAGLSRYDLRSRSWTIYNEKNTPMHEIWCYGVSASGPTVYLAVWGGGLLEYDLGSDLWKEYRDPDREMEIDLFRDDGLVHDVVASVWFSGRRVWTATYFGVSSYDGRHWRTYMDSDSGLASNFVNFVKGEGETVWLCTDRGLSSFDGTTWTTYARRDDGRGVVASGFGDSRKEIVTADAIAGNYVLCVDFQGEDIWVGTASGLSVGRYRPAGEAPRGVETARGAGR